MKKACDLQMIALATSKEAELINMQMNKIELCLEVVAKADDSGTALLVPPICDLFQLVRVQAAVVELVRDVGMEGIADVKLELAVQKTLLARIQ